MAKLNFNIPWYAFDEGLRVLRASYKAVSKALHEEIDRAKDEAVVYQQHLNQGGKSLDRRDEDGNVLWDQETILSMQVDAAEQAAMAQRKAFSIAIYHHWERSIRKLTGCEKTGHNNLVKAAEASGVPADPKLGAVCALVNLLKHDNDDRAGELRKCWPDLLPASSKSPFAGWYDAVHLKEMDIEEILDIVTRSGPRKPARLSIHDLL